MRSSGRNIIILIIASFLVRALAAGLTGFGVDEAYYFSYALYPDWSYFDHPPLVGVLIRIFTLDLSLQGEFFVRLGSLVFGTVNTWIVYKTGELLRGNRAGFIAALLYTSSFYCSVIVGVFIMPDTPQSLFWLLSLYIFLKFIKTDNANLLFWFGLITGFALLSKYHAAFLWAAALLYILLKKRDVLQNYRLYAALIITLLIFSPVIYWNISNELATFAYHSERVGSDLFRLRFDYFLTELFGQIFYNNPINFILIVSSIVLLQRNFNEKFDKDLLFLSLTAFPIILTVLGMSLLNKTLPHWSGPGYYSLIFIAAYVLDDKLEAGQKGPPKWLIAAPSFFMLIVVWGLLQINYGIIPMRSNDNPHELGRFDASLDMYGWEDLREKFAAFAGEEVQNGLISADYYIVTANWFPACYLDYYIAQRLDKKVYVLGRFDQLHHYARINKLRGNINAGEDVYYITTSRYYRHLRDEFKNLFESASEPKAITIYRAGKPAYNAFITRLNNARQEIDFGKFNKGYE